MKNLVTKTLIGIFLIAMTAISGCVLPVSEKAKIKTDKTSVVIVGVENGFGGKCVGAIKDTKTMKTLLSKYSSKVVVLTDKAATTAKVKAALSEAVKNDLAIFYFSGHGGTAKFVDTGSEEVDGKDEYIYCYDACIKDNDIWSIICKAKGRVMLIFDCCHSETMYRTGFQFLKAEQESKTALFKAGTLPNMLCWSGCPDSDYSYGTASGGKFTLTLKSACTSSYTYDKAWKKIADNKTLKKAQTVKQTKIGKFETAKTKVFR